MLVSMEGGPARERLGRHGHQRDLWSYHAGRSALLRQELPERGVAEHERTPTFDRACACLIGDHFSVPFSVLASPRVLLTPGERY